MTRITARMINPNQHHPNCGRHTMRRFSAYRHFDRHGENHFESQQQQRWALPPIVQSYSPSSISTHNTPVTSANRRHLSVANLPPVSHTELADTGPSSHRKLSDQLRPRPSVLLQSICYLCMLLATCTVVTSTYTIVACDAVFYVHYGAAPSAVSFVCAYLTSVSREMDSESVRSPARIHHYPRRVNTAS